MQGMVCSDSGHGQHSTGDPPPASRGPSVLPEDGPEVSACSIMRNEDFPESSSTHPPTHIPQSKQANLFLFLWAQALLPALLLWGPRTGLRVHLSEWRQVSHSGWVRPGSPHLGTDTAEREGLRAGGWCPSPWAPRPDGAETVCELQARLPSFHGRCVYRVKGGSGRH